MLSHRFILNHLQKSQRQGRNRSNPIGHDVLPQLRSTNFENKLSEHTTLGKDDTTSTWQVEADTESLRREARAFIKDQCEFLFEACHGEMYGLIGVVTRDQIPLSRNAD